ncbi:MAG: Asp23/Gls24 family envelope stress response protein [Erysipelothrix sp.]|jgi:uncharacterized alkaline shock family protein YloU|nr:Asp23/Gls24 family envelope stress response protein [Erysipelothrix sp.]
MANEYIRLKQHDELGIIAITKHAFELITIYTIEDDEDVEIVTSKFTRPVNVRINNNKLYVTVDVAVQYGKNVNAVIERLQERIVQSIQDMTEYQSSTVNINVTGVVF